MRDAIKDVEETMQIGKVPFFVDNLRPQNGDNQDDSKDTPVAAESTVPWLSTAAWEVNQNCFHDFPSVVTACEEHLTEYVKKWSGGLQPLFMYVCGQDHVRNIPSGCFKGNQGLCVVQRGVDGNNDFARLPLARLAPNHHYLVPALPVKDLATASSTFIRTAFLSGEIGPQDPVASIVAPSTLAFLQTEFLIKLRSRHTRTVFISASALYSRIKGNPRSLISPTSLFFFGSKRFWLFPSTQKERQESQRQPTDYGGFSDEFKSLVITKEKEGRVCFLKPDVVGAIDIPGGIVGDYKKASTWLQTVPIADVEGRNSDLYVGYSTYLPLRLNKTFWEKTFDDKKQSWWESQLCAVEGVKSMLRCSGRRVVANFLEGRHDYAAVVELLRQSNPLMHVVC